ncbi:MAG: helix-turn-helix transcriptional regulator [Candidatus Eisenbacteria bacterium]|nr:helix-turn-helix transcriptional regulator [Candidatus Eisenbacteria bacterium]
MREAARLFDEKGYEQTTVDEIVARADVAKGTFFNYFARKDALLSHVLDRRLRFAESVTAELLSVATSVADKLLAIYSEAASAWEEDRAFSKHVLAGLGPGGHPAGERSARWRAQVQHAIRLGQKSGELRAGASPERAEAVLTAVYHDTLSRWAAGEVIELQDHLLAQLMLVLEGLAE